MAKTSKRHRLEQMTLLLKTSPKGLKRSEIAKLLGVHRSTVGRDIIELGEETMLWEENFRVGINERRKNPQIHLSLPENFSILIAIQALLHSLDAPIPVLSTTLRKIALSMQHRFPVCSEKMNLLAEKMGNLSDPFKLTSTDNLAILIEALESKSLLNITMPISNHIAQIWPNDFSTAKTGSFKKSLRLTGKCENTGRNCSFLIHNIKFLKEVFPGEELLGCPFQSTDLEGNYLLPIKIYSIDVINKLGTITDFHFRFEKLNNGIFNVEILVPEKNKIQDILTELGSDIEVIYPESLQYNLEVQIEHKQSYESTQIKEVHHRIQNQLINLMGLIDLYNNNQDHSVPILDEINAKLLAISTVHSMLSTGNLWARFPVSDYITELCMNLIDSMAINKKIDLIIDIDKFSLKEDQITNIGIIVTELCINSLKHAFIDKTRGEISISMYKEDKFIILRFKDNGIGWENIQDKTLREGTGHNLVNIFVDRLSGSIEFQSKEGTEAVITFVETT